MKLSSKLKAGVAALAIAGVAVAGAQALTSTFSLTVTFIDPFSITETTAANYGRVAAGVNTTYTQTALGVVTAGPGGAAFPAPAPTAGVYSIVDASAGAALVDVTVGNQQAGANGFVTVTGFSCTYGAAAAAGATCTYNAAANPGAGGTPLNVGFNITVAGSPVNNATDTVAFDVSVAYD